MVSGPDTAARLVTSAPEITRPPRFLPTGNLWLSLPEISLDDGSVRSLGVLLSLSAAWSRPMAAPLACSALSSA